VWDGTLVSGQRVPAVFGSLRRLRVLTVVATGYDRSREMCMTVLCHRYEEVPRPFSGALGHEVASVVVARARAILPRRPGEIASERMK